MCAWHLLKKCIFSWRFSWVIPCDANIHHLWQQCQSFKILCTVGLSGLSAACDEWDVFLHLIHISHVQKEQGKRLEWGAQPAPSRRKRTTGSGVFPSPSRSDCRRGSEEFLDFNKIRFQVSAFNVTLLKITKTKQKKTLKYSFCGFINSSYFPTASWSKYQPNKCLPTPVCRDVTTASLNMLQEDPAALWASQYVQASPQMLKWILL